MVSNRNPVTCYIYIYIYKQTNLVLYECFGRCMIDMCIWDLSQVHAGAKQLEKASREAVPNEMRSI